MHGPRKIFAASTKPEACQGAEHDLVPKLGGALAMVVCAEADQAALANQSLKEKFVAIWKQGTFRFLDAGCVTQAAAHLRDALRQPVQQPISLC